MTLQDKATIVNDDIKTSFGGDTPLVDIVTNQADPLVNLVTTLLAGQTTVDEAIIFLQSGLYASDVGGSDLTLVAQLSGTDRQIDQPSKAPIIVMGQAGAVLPAGSILTDRQGVEWTTTLPAVIQDCYGYTNACSPVGRFDLRNGELKLRDSFNNIDKATNAAAPSLGGEFETDTNLRNRLLGKRPQWQNKGTASALIWELEQLTGVFDAKVITDLPACFNQSTFLCPADELYTGVSFSVAAEDVAPVGLVWDDSNLWMVGNSVGAVYKYNAAGLYTGTSFSLAGEDSSPVGATWDGSDFWILGSNTDTVYKYDAAGVYSGVSFSIAAEDPSPKGITWDGTSFWMLGGTADTVYEYDAGGTYTGTSVSIAAQDILPQNIMWDGSYFWMVGTDTDTVYQYDNAWLYTGFSFSVSAQDTSPTAITWDGESIWMVGAFTDAAYKYTLTEDVVYTTNNYMISVLGGTPADIAETIYENLCFGTDRLIGDTVVPVRCDEVQFQPMCAVKVEVRYWLRCDCQSPEGANDLDQLIVDRLNENALNQDYWSSTDLCKVSKDLLKAEFRLIPKPIVPDCADCDLFDNPITGQVDEEYCTSDLNTKCFTGTCGGGDWSDCVTLQPWWYPVFLPTLVTAQTGCPCPTPSNACGCAA